MNKNLFRIIFNQRRGQLMAVSETATATGKAASGEGAPMGGTASSGAVGNLVATLGPLCLSVLASLGIVMFTMGSVGAQVIADPSAPGSQRPTVLQTTNGLPQINIQTPSAAGVSRNTYRQFDIQSNGAILNNSRTNTQTQLGGWVQGNPWLATGSARVILNEVNSANPSQLRGYIEVAGQSAEVIIANPAGVNADGAGFINANRVTITTGTPQINGGNLEGYLVQRGTVTINGKGLDATLTDYTGILARAVRVNAGIWAKDLKIVTGANQINAEHTTHTATASTGAAPTFALDVAQLGGMYAGKITLIGTESGVGVRNAGVIGATAGDVVLQADGWLTNSGSIQTSGNGGDTQISTIGDIANGGTVYATGNTNVKARGNISISGLVAAQNNATVLANGATSRIDATAGAVLVSGLNSNGTLGTVGVLQVQGSTGVAIQGKTASAGNTNITGSQLDLSGANVSGTSLTLTATIGDLNAAHAIVTAQGIVRAQTPQMLRTDGAQVTANQINIAAHDLSNIGGQITQSGTTDLTIQLPGNLNNSQGQIATNSQNLTLGATVLTNTDGKIGHAGTGSLNIGATAFDGHRGITTSNGALNLNATTVNTDSATTTANQVTINSNTLSNRSGHISQTGAGQTTVVANQRLDNTAGKIETNGIATISTATLLNTQGRIASAKNANITASNSADNPDGIITAAQNVVLTGGNVSNTHGEIQAVGGNATINVADLSNNAGNIYAGANLATTAANINNSGNLYAVGNQTLNAGATINNTGVIAAQGDNTISATRLTSGATSLIGAGIKADGTLSTARNLNITTTQGLTANGQNVAAGNATVTGAWVNLSSSQTSATRIAVTATDGNVTTDHATVTTPGTLSVTANAQNTQTLSNAQGVLSAGQFDINVANLNNMQGNIVQTGIGNTAIILTSLGSTLDNTAGRIATNGQNLTIGANTLTNTDGKIEHAGTGTLAMTAATLNDQRGQITGNGTLTIAAGNIDHRSASTTAWQVTIAATNLDNRQGEITQLGSGDTSITASQTLENSQGRIQTNGAVSIGATTLLNAQGRITAGQSANVSASSSLNNTDGTIVTNSDLTLIAGNVDNTRGSLQAVTGNAVLQLSNLNNSTGSIYAGSQLDTSAANVTNAGNLYAAGAQTLNVTGTIDNTGVIAAQGDSTITANSLTSSATSLLGAGIKADGTLANIGNLSITSAQGLTAHGQNLAAGNAVLSGSSVDLSSGQTGAANIAVTATSGDVVSNNATVTTPGTLAITASAQNTQSWTNNQGIVSAKQLDVRVANLNNTLGEIVQTGTGDTAINLTSPAGALDNTSGPIAVNSNNLTLIAQTLTNIDGKIEHAGSASLAISVGNLNDQRGQITSNGSLNVAAGNIDHRSASTIAQQVTIAATNMDNRQGEITQLGAGPTSIAIAQNLDNRAGSIATNGNTNISAQTLDNAGGNLRASGTSNLNITTTAALDNSGAGHITAGGNAILVTDAIVNQQGEITASGTLTATVTQSVQNTQGLIAANGNAILTAATLDNIRGTLASVHGNLNATTLGSMNNDSGKLQADGDVTLTNSGLTNTQAAGQTTAGSITGRNIAIDAHSLALNNQFGSIVATQSANLQTGALNNNAGLIQAGTALIVNTHGQILTNTNANGYTARNPGIPGGIASSGTATIDTGALNNTNGFFGAVGAISGTTGQIDNTADGQIVGNSSLNLTISGLNNQGGQIQTQGGVTLNAGGGAIDNRYSLIRSNAAVSLTAATIDNRNTQGSNQGIEGNDVALNTTAVNNALGAIRADNNLTVTNANSVINTQGLMSAGNTLSIQDQVASRTLAITNTNGTLIAGQYNTLRAASLTGDGRVLSKQDLKVDLTSSYTNGTGGEITANRDAIITTTGNLTNSSKLQASGKLTINANNIDNTVTGDINAGTTQVTATNVLTNRSVIDGVNTEINATTLNNLGTGRIYGDHLSISATTVNNNPEGGVAATIAARNRLDIGAQALNNGEHALIFSGGDMAIGGSLDANRHVTGQAGTVNNASATIEALGSLSLSAAQVNNLNNHFSTQIQAVGGTQSITEYQGSGSPNRYLAGTPDVNVYTDESLHLHTPEANYESWTQYDVTRTVRESVVATSDPGRILAGGNLTINAGTVLNDDSHIIAGAALNINAVSLLNPQTLGQRITKDLGTATSYWRDFQKDSVDRTGSSVAAYAPPDTIQAISLSASRQDSYTAPAGSGTTLASAVTPTVAGNTSAAGTASANVNPAAIVNVLANVNAVNAATGQGANTATATSGPNATTRAGSAGQASALGAAAGAAAGTAIGTNAPSQARVSPITQVALANPSGGAQSVRTTTPPTRIPNTSLFAINPIPTAGYLIETDPRFTNYRQWVSSDYVLGQIQLDPAVTQKRLGDGFYEQRLIREQVAQLTGLRFLGDFSSDDAQYRALMDAGLTYAKASNVRPGIALSAAQMAVLTSDIVWLVEQEVSLADGSKQRALVPQVYVRVRDGDVDGNGSLLAGKEVNINLSGDLTNVGTIAGRSIVNITADNVQNLGGRINGDAISVAAQTDLNNIGGAISANSQLQVSAGRDINIETTVRSAASSAGGNSFSRVTFDRVAGLYVSGDAGGSTLVATAGRDVNVIAGVIGNGGTDGATFISATRNLNLGTITTAASNNLKWDDNNRRSDSESAEIGSQIQGVGRVDLAAGQDINLRAATVQTGGTLTAVAGNDINLIAGQSTQSVDEAHQHTSKSLFSSKTVTTRDSMNGTSAIGSTLEGQNVLLSSGQDVNLQGAAVNADQALIVDAKRDVNITAAEDTRGETHFSQTRREATGLAKGLATMIAIVDPIAALTPNSINQVAIAALITKKNETADQDGISKTAVGSQLTGGRIDIQSGRDALVKGSTIVADGDVSVIAGRDLTVTTAQNTQAGQFTTTEKTIGLLRFDEKGNSVGKREQDQAQQTTATSHTASQIVSLGKGGTEGNEGSVDLSAIGNTTLTGSSVMAPAGDIHISGANVVINEVHNSATQASQTHARETAATAQVKSGYVDATKGAYESVQTARDAKENTGSDRMAGLAAINAAVSVYNAYSDIKGSAIATSQNPSPFNAADASANAAPLSAISISGSIGIGKSESDSTSSQRIAQGVQLAAGGALNITAKGDADASIGNGNLTMIGAKVIAGQAATLSATGEINLLAAENTTQVHSTNSSSNASLGMTFALGGTQNGFSFQIGAQGARGLVNGEETTYSNTQIRVGDADRPGTLTINSRGDTTLRGASASADRITTDIGGNLLIESLKDKIKYDSQQTSVGGGVALCIPPICYGQMVVVNVNAAESTIKADHDSVAAADEQRGQSGLKAGDSGFDVKVAGHTDLIGGVIASTAAAEKNTLTTGTLTFTDIANHSETEAHSDAVSLSSSMASSGYGAAKGVAENLAAHAVASKSEDSATRSAVSAGTLTITDQDAQTQDVALLSRDTTSTHRGLELMDRQALQKEVEVRREIQSMTVKTVELFTDEAHRVMFKVTPKILKVTCRQEPCAYGGERTPDANRNVVVGGETVKNIAYEEVKPENLPHDGSARIAVNGISNDEQRAAELAMQNTPLDLNTKTKPKEIYVVYYQKADNVASELLVATYEKFMAKTFGYTNPDNMTATMVQQQGDNATLLEGHSRGSLVVDNALTILQSVFSLPVAAIPPCPSSTSARRVRYAKNALHCA